MKKYNFLLTFPETNESNAEEVEITKELLWDEADHSECTEEEKIQKKVIYTMQIIKQTQIYKSI